MQKRRLGQSFGLDTQFCFESCRWKKSHLPYRFVKSYLWYSEWFMIANEQIPQFCRVHTLALKVTALLSVACSDRITIEFFGHLRSSIILCKKFLSVWPLETKPFLMATTSDQSLSVCHYCLSLYLYIVANCHWLYKSVVFAGTCVQF